MRVSEGWGRGANALRRLLFFRYLRLQQNLLCSIFRMKSATNSDSYVKRGGDKNGLLFSQNRWQHAADETTIPESRLLYPVCLTVDAEKGHQIVAPDFSCLMVCDDNRHRALTRIQLCIEGTASDLLLQGSPLPAPSCVAKLRKRPEYMGYEMLQIDIHPLQLQAVAAHQARR